MQKTMGNPLLFPLVWHLSYYVMAFRVLGLGLPLFPVHKPNGSIDFCLLHAKLP